MSATSTGNPKQCDHAPSKRKVVTAVPIECRVLEELIAEMESALAAIQEDADRDELALALTGLRRKRETAIHRSALQ